MWITYGQIKSHLVKCVHTVLTAYHRGLIFTTMSLMLGLLTWQADTSPCPKHWCQPQMMTCLVAEWVVLWQIYFKTPGKKLIFSFAIPLKWDHLGDNCEFRVYPSKSVTFKQLVSFYFLEHFRFTGKLSRR